MIAADVDRTGRQAPAKVSALIVSIENSEPGTEPDPDSDPALTYATRFARWLINRCHFPADRVTLMVSSHDVDWRQPAERRGDLLKGLAYEGKKPTLLRDASAQNGFATWITKHGPQADDDLFVLFWVGGGCVRLDDNDHVDGVCLLGSDATTQKPWHVDLGRLLDTVGGYAPGAARVALVDAAWRDMKPGWQERLARYEVTLPEAPPRLGPYPPQARIDPFAVYAAAYGQAATGARWVANRKSFAERLLHWLLPEWQADPRGRPEPHRDVGPLGLFDDTDALTLRLRNLASDQRAAPFWTCYGYWAGSQRPEPFVAPHDNDLTPAEWDQLLKVARAIDTDPRAKPAWEVLLGAYCHAVGEGATQLPAQPESVTDLVRGLRDRRPLAMELPPPLVVACDVVASLPSADLRPALRRWCDDWASAGARGARLELARQRRPVGVPSQPYLSILVDDASGDGARYHVSALLWAAGGLELIPAIEVVGQDEILVATRELLGRATGRPSVMHPDDLVVEFVLPRALLGWRPVTDELGIGRPIVIRDLERLRRRPLEGASRSMAEANWHKIEQLSRPRARHLSQQIRWFDCHQLPPSSQGIEAAAITSPGIGLAYRCPGAPGAADRAEPPPGLLEAVQAGAALVVWIWHDPDWHLPPPRRHGLGAMWPSHDCGVLGIKSRIAKGVDRRRANGLRDLPFVLRDVRQELTNSRLPPEALSSVGVLMEDSSRLWPGYFRLEQAEAS